MAEQEYDETEQLLTPGEVAEIFRVNAKTVTRWSRTGKISAIKTMGGHRRFRASEIRKFIEEQQSDGVEIDLSNTKLSGPSIWTPKTK
jgi:excisionase family DNA binding protein